MLISLGLEILSRLVCACNGMGTFDRRNNAFGLAEILESAHGFLIGRPRIVDTSDFLEPCVLRTHRGVVQTSGDGIRIEGLAFGILKKIALGTLKHTQFTGSRCEANGMASGFRTIAACLIAVQVHAFVIKERIHDADGIGTATDACTNRIRVIDTIPILKLLLSFLADDLLEIAHHSREWMRTGNSAQQVVSVFYIGNPVTKSLVDGVLENAISQSDFHHLGTEHAHASDVKRLTTRIDLAHVDTALQSKHGAHRSGGDTVLTCTGFSNDPSLAHALDQQGLTECIVDLVRASVVQILTLEEHAGVKTSLFPQTLGKARRIGQR